MVPTYDLDRLSPDFPASSSGADFVATGQAKRDFHLSGNFTRIANLKSGAAIAWTSARTHGFDVGPGELKLALSGGTLATNAIEANFSGGRVRAQVSIHLDPAPQEAILAPGMLLERAQEAHVPGDERSRRLRSAGDRELGKCRG